MNIINIFCDKASKQARKIFLRSQFNTVDKKEDAQILWIRSKYKQALPDLAKEQIINHLPGEGEVTTKGKLTLNLKLQDCKINPALSNINSKQASKPKKNKKKCQTTGNQVNIDSSNSNKKIFTSSNFYKESYLLSDKNDLSAFFTNTRDSNQDLWILKPSNLSKGCGVKIVDNVLDLKEVILNQEKPEYTERYKNYFYYEDEEEEYIIQRLISSPLLLNNKKSEIRIYWLVLSLDPLSVVIYKDPIVRLCSEDYEEGDYSNPLKHITNVHQQKQYSQEEEFSDDDLKWSLEKLKQDVFNQDLSTNPHFFEEEVFPKIKKAIAYIIQSAKKSMLKSPLLKKHKQLSVFNYFALFGCDIMLDRELNPWVLEVQRGPGLSFEHESKADVLLPMARGAIESLHKYKFSEDTMFELPQGFSWLIYKNRLVND